MTVTRSFAKNMSAAAIQTAFRQFRIRKRSLACKAKRRVTRSRANSNASSTYANEDDVDPISRERIQDVPEARLFSITESNGKTYAYDSYAWIRWIVHHTAHPLTREPLSPQSVKACYESAKRSVKMDADAPSYVERCIQKLEVPVRVHYVTILAMHPFRWTMLLFVSPLYHLRSVSVEISDHAPHQASIRYDARKKTAASTKRLPMEARIQPKGKYVRIDAVQFAIGTDDAAVDTAIDVQRMDREEEEEEDEQEEDDGEGDGNESEYTE